MAFSESTAVADRDAFIQAIIAFAVANAGFTDQGHTIDGTNKIYHISKGSIYWNFVEDSYYFNTTHYAILSRMSFAKITTFVAFEANTTAGQRYPTRMIVYRSTGPYTKYFLYTDGNAVHCVLQIYTGVYSHISFGNMNIYGSWTGGEYLTAMGCYYYSSGYITWDYSRNGILFDGGIHNISSSVYPTGYVRYIIGTPANDQTDFARLGSITQNSQQCRMVTATGIVKTLIEDCSPLGFNMRSPIFPIYVRMRENATGRFILSGHITYARVVNVSLLAPEVVAENDWIVFPMTQRTGGDTALAPISDNWGVAYKRVA